MAIRKSRRVAPSSFREDMLKRLKAEGVKSVPELVDRVLAFRKSSTDDPGPKPLLTSGALPRDKKDRKELIHRPPLVPLYIDGAPVKASRISQFNGRPLHFVVVTLPNKELVLHAFTNSTHLDLLRADYLHWLNWVMGAPSGRGGTQPPTSGEGPAGGRGGGVVIPSPLEMFQDINYGGDELGLPYGYEWSDLTQVCRSSFLWWCNDSWNDEISSLGGSGNDIVCWSDINFEGNSLRLSPYFPIPD
jgi:hypothetical protein